MVRAVGKMLGFQAEALMAVEAGAALSHVCLQPVGRIELHTRLVGQTVQIITKCLLIGQLFISLARFSF